MVEFVLEITTLNLMVKLYKNFLATAIGTKFARPYAYIFMEKVEIEFLESQAFGMVSVHRRCLFYLKSW